MEIIFNKNNTSRKFVQSLISSPDELKKTKEIVKNVFQQLPWFFETEELINKYVLKIAMHNQFGFFEQFEQSLKAVQKFGESYKIILERLLNPEGPFTKGHVEQVVKTVLSENEEPAGIRLLTIDGEVIISKSLYELYKSLPQVITLSTYMSQIEKELENFELEGTPDQQVQLISKTLFSKNLFRPGFSGVPIPNQIDPRPIFYMFLDSKTSKEFDLWLDATQDMVRSKASLQFYKPVGRVALDSNECITNAGKIIQKLIRIRSNIFDEISCAVVSDTFEKMEKSYQELYPYILKATQGYSIKFTFVLDSAENVQKNISILRKFMQRKSSDTLFDWGYVFHSTNDVKDGEFLEGGLGLGGFPKFLFKNCKASELPHEFIPSFLRTQMNCASNLSFTVRSETIQDGCPMTGPQGSEEDKFQALSNIFKILPVHVSKPIPVSRDTHFCL